METTGYRDLDENMQELKKLQDDGRIAGMAFDQIRSLAVESRDLRQAVKTMSKELAEADKRWTELKNIAVGMCNAALSLDDYRNRLQEHLTTPAGGEGE